MNTLHIKKGDNVTVLSGNEKEAFDNFEVAHNFQDIGHKIMLLNARQIYRKDIDSKTFENHKAR